MTTPLENQSIEWGAAAPTGTYQCASCGFLLQHGNDGELPACPRDEGHHKLKDWHCIRSMEDCDPTLPNSPIKDR